MAKDLVGDWERAISDFEKLPKLARDNLNLATDKNAITVQSKIKKGIYAGRQGIAPLAKLTKTVKKSSRPFVDYGDLAKALGVAKLAPGMYFVGWRRGERNRQGVEIVNIARVLHYGMTIVPKKGKKLLAPLHREAQEEYRRAGSAYKIPGLFHLPGSRLLGKAEGNKFVPWFIMLPKVTIPPRDYIEPGVQEAKPICLRRWRSATRAIAEGRRYRG